jgi:hypothetical protein
MRERAVIGIGGDVHWLSYLGTGRQSADIFFSYRFLLELRPRFLLNFFVTIIMSTDTRSHRDRAAPSKRKTRDGSEDAAPARKKPHHKADKADGQPQFTDFGNGDDAKPKPARKYKDKFAPRLEKEYPSVNDLKKRIRDVKRQLNKVDLKPEARILQERALAGYEQDLADENARRERSSLIKKYHFVRFLGMQLTRSILC